MVIMTDSPTAKTETAIDLIGIEKDLADVEIALSRLEAGTYWTCEVTGEPLSDELLASRPTTRRASHP
jgi:RNA polymerase-binding transcription factor DksA